VSQQIRLRHNKNRDVRIFLRVQVVLHLQILDIYILLLFNLKHL